ncbi:MAG TPA: ArsA family ATPase [Candidatus Tripitaka californicus]
MERLREMARELYGDRDPTEVFVSERPVKLTQHNGSCCLSLHLPTANEKDLELSMYKNELIIRLGSYKRNVLLPRAIADRKLVKAAFEGKRLNITFGGRKDGEGR